MLIPDVNSRELGELLDHFESRSDIWKEPYPGVWARYNGDSVTVVVELSTETHQIMRVEVTWADDDFQSVTYITWLLNHFTSRGLRLRLQTLLPNIGPNMVASIVDLLDGWQEQKSEDDLAAEELKTEKEQRVLKMRIVNQGTRPPLSPYLKKLLGRK